MIIFYSVVSHLRLMCRIPSLGNSNLFISPITSAQLCALSVVIERGW